MLFSTNVAESGIICSAKNGVRRTKLIGPLREFPTKSSAWQAADEILQALLDKPITQIHTVRELAHRYQFERMPSRSETARVYSSWLRNHILPRWGSTSIADVQPRSVELWLRQLNLSPKSKSHVRNLLRVLTEFAMWCGVLEIQRNPIDLVVVKGATKRIRKPRSLTVKQFQKLKGFLNTPFDTMALLAVCLGLRVSELLALKWRDVDWLGAKLSVERGIDKQIVDDVNRIFSQVFVSCRGIAKCVEDVEADHNVLSGRGSDLCQSCKAGSASILIYRILARTGAGSTRSGRWASRNSCFSAYVPQLARCSGNANCSSAEAHAP